ncbi:peptidylprolyl isomerase [Pseudohoeflea coraliihabitans]|uniref:peptidylprolyl isomerase n=1 Tax=Pseudohoeflea coraliihabitans TaxID=2860393 RepID=A0ABS6WS58_9HYPH|nr:peptidylprolyl isomerase [Pseudohoeflea sp. DP4N28-3]MBW3098247.1 peptidylprolyl isomerase [Pseudohoeflea sp. DP4N28-3]
MRIREYLTAAATAVALSLSLTAFSGGMGAAQAAERLTMQLADGPVVIELNDQAPKHAKRLSELAAAGAYDNVAFHRVIEGFMAQTGDVQFGDMEDGYDERRAGTGGSDKPDLNAEFTDQPFKRGTVGMARSADPNSANSQFFIMFAPAEHLNGQYTVVGEVVSGMEHVDAIKRGSPPNGAVSAPDKIITMKAGG